MMHTDSEVMVFIMRPHSTRRLDERLPDLVNNTEGEMDLTDRQEDDADIVGWRASTKVGQQSISQWAS